MLRFMLIIIMVSILIYYVCDDYATYKRLNNVVDNLICYTDMSDDDKSDNLSWLYRNCIRFSERSVFFGQLYQSVAVKIQQFCKG